MTETVDASASEPMAETTEEEPQVRPINVFPERPIKLTPESTPCIYWNGKYFYWCSVVNRAQVPSTFNPSAEFYATQKILDGSDQNEGYEFKAVIYEDEKATEVIYVWFDALCFDSWTHGNFVRFKTVFMRDQGWALICFDGNYYSMIEGMQFSAKVETLPEGYQVAGTLNQIESDYLPQNHLETNSGDGSGHSLKGNEVYYSENCTDIIYVKINVSRDEWAYRPAYLIGEVQ